MSKEFWLPFEVKPCDEHGWECGGIPEPRYDLPVFLCSEDVHTWMTDDRNAHIHKCDGEQVRLQWIEHTAEEAEVMGFIPPKKEMH